MQSVIRQKTDSLIRFIQKEASDGEPVDVRVAFMAWSADFITGCIFDQSLGLLNDPERAKKWFHDLAANDFLFPWFKRFPFLTTLGLKLPPWALPPGAEPVFCLHNVGRDFPMSPAIPRHSLVDKV